ncbi:MAG: hypothetical protein OXI58_03360 [Gemmatimonadota bacterium]|nr:hypothetical protein [Gemmatimonadota bacterium]
MTNSLFYEEDLSDALRAREQRMLDEINSLNENRVLNTSEDDLYDYFVEKYKMEALQIDEEQIKIDYGDAKIDISQSAGYVIWDRSRPLYVTGTRITFYIPFSGNSALLKLQPSTYSLNPPRADVADSEIVMVYERTNPEAMKIEDEFKSEIERLRNYLKWIRQDVTAFNSLVREKASQGIKSRREKILKDRELVEKIGFPIRRRQDTPNTYIAPQVKRAITPKLPPASTEPYKPEPTLDIQNYEHILSVVSNMVMVMERSPRAFRDMDEEDLRQHFLVQLNGQYEGQATGETFNFEVKTDILIRADDKNIFIAECKFWKGPKAFREAIDQLLSYSTWRDTKTALLVFNRNTEMATVLNRIPEEVKAHSKYKGSRTYDSETGFRYIFRHRDDANREIVLTVLVFNVPA